MVHQTISNSYIPLFMTHKHNRLKADTKFTTKKKPFSTLNYNLKFVFLYNLAFINTQLLATAGRNCLCVLCDKSGVDSDNFVRLLVVAIIKGLVVKGCGEVVELMS